MSDVFYFGDIPIKFFNCHRENSMSILLLMILAVIAFTLNSLRNYFMYNQENLIDDEDDDDSDDDDAPGNSTILDKIHGIMAYICTYLWGLSLIILIFLIYVSIRDPLNIIHRFPTGKNFKME